MGRIVCNWYFIFSSFHEFKCDVSPCTSGSFLAYECSLLYLRNA